jgi:hypothetical protein
MQLRDVSLTYLNLHKHGLKCVYFQPEEEDCSSDELVRQEIELAEGRNQISNKPLKFLGQYFDVVVGC